MKSAVQFAVVGLIALGCQANAQMAQAVRQQTVDHLGKSAAAREFLVNKLGVRTGSAADVNAAILKLDTAQRAAVLKAIASFESKYIDNSGPAAVAANENLAKSAFSTTTGIQNIQLAANAQGVSSNTAVKAVTGAKGETCGTKLTALELAQAKPKASVAEIQRALDDGNLTNGNCKEDVREKAETARTATDIAVCMSRKGVNKNSAREVRIATSADCISEELQRPIEDARASAGAIAGKCDWFSAAANDNAPLKQAVGQ